MRSIEAQNPPDELGLMGTLDIARFLGVSRQAVLQMRNASARTKFPKPLGRTSAGLVWDRRDIEAYKERRARLRGLLGHPGRSS